MIEIVSSEIVFNSFRTYLEIERIVEDQTKRNRRYYIYIPLNSEERNLLGGIVEGMAVRLEVKVK